MGIIAWIILGLLAGVIAKAVLPGSDPGGLIVTTLVGVAGALLGGFIARALDVGDIRNALRSLMWRRAGITRDAAGLAEAARQVDYWRGYVLPHAFDEPGAQGFMRHDPRLSADGLGRYLAFLNTTLAP